MVVADVVAVEAAGPIRLPRRWRRPRPIWGGGFFFFFFFFFFVVVEAPIHVKNVSKDRAIASARELLARVRYRGQGRRSAALSPARLEHILTRALSAPKRAFRHSSLMANASRSSISIKLLPLSPLAASRKAALLRHMTTPTRAANFSIKSAGSNPKSFASAARMARALDIGTSIVRAVSPTAGQSC